MWRFASSLLLLHLAACGDDGGIGPADATPADASSDGVVIDPDGPAPPEIDWLDEGAPAIAAAQAPLMTCPAGWRSVEIGGVTACDPYPASGSETCGAHEAHFVGGTGCKRVGTTCASDGWPTGLPSSGVVFVRPGGSGDGSRASPFGRVADALSSSATTIALAEGRYDEAVSLGAGKALVGACPQTTILTRGVTLNGDGAGLSNVSLEGTAGLTSRATATVESVVVDTSSGTAISVTADTLSLTSVSIRGSAANGLSVLTGAEAVGERMAISERTGDAISVSGSGARAALSDVSIDGAGGYGLSVSSGASARMERGLILESGRAGVSNANGEVELVDVVIRGDGAAPDSRVEQGIVQSAGTGTLSRVLIEEAGWAAVDMWDGSLGATDLVVASTSAVEGDPFSGYGINAFSGTLTVERAHVAQNVNCGIITDADSVTLTDVTVVETRESVPTPSGASFGCAMQISARTATLERIRARENVRYGVSLLGEETVATIRDVHVTDTVGSVADGEGGEGIFALQGATVDAERVMVERSEFAGFAIRDGSTFTATDLVARDVTAPDNFGISGYGVRVEVGGDARVNRGLIERIGLAGIHVVDDGSTFTGSDLVVRDMMGEEQFGLHGWGLGATNGGQADLTRVRFSRPRYVGLVTNGAGSRLTAVDLVLEDTLEARCADDLCADAPFGIGLGAYSGAAVDLRSFLITRSHVIGVQLAGEGMIDLADGEVSMSPVGANVQTDPFMIERLTSDVSYRENQQNLVTDALPVPTFGGL